MRKSWKGFSMWVAFGKYAGFGFHLDRIVLGWVSIVFWFPYDLENILNDLSVEAGRYQELIMAVTKKYTNETRFETALRYIKERENEG